MSKLNEQELKRIENIENHLLSLNKVFGCYAGLSIVPEFTPIAPVEETQYVECVNTGDWEGKITVGKIYKVEREDDNYYYIIEDTGIEGDFYKTRFKPLTLSAFTAQNTIAQKEWKPQVGEWYKTSKNNLYLCTGGSESRAFGSSQCEKRVQSITPYTSIAKPTPEEIQAHLTKIFSDRLNNPEAERTYEIDVDKKTISCVVKLK